MLEREGIYSAKGDELVDLTIIAGDTRETVYEPNDKDIARLCDKYDLPRAYTLGVIQQRQRGAHTVFIIVEQFLEHCKELGLIDPT